MPFLEMRALALAAATWGHLWRCKKITFRCDCMPVVQAFEQARSRSTVQMHQIRSLHQMAAKHGFDFRVAHIAGVTNTVADVLSRVGDCQEFRALCPYPACSLGTRARARGRTPPGARRDARPSR